MPQDATPETDATGLTAVEVDVTLCSDNPIQEDPDRNEGLRVVVRPDVLRGLRRFDARVQELRKQFISSSLGPSREAVSDALEAVWRDYGASLAELLPSAVRRTVVEAVQVERRSVIVRLRSADGRYGSELGALPWESTWLDEIKGPLGLHDSIIVVRSYKSASSNPIRHVEKPLTVTTAIFGPYGSAHLDDLDTDAEFEAIIAATMSRERELRVTEIDATDVGVSRLFETDVLHVASHGLRGSVLIGQWSGPPRHVPASEFADLVAKSPHAPPLVVLSTCLSGSGLADDESPGGLSDVASALVAESTACVVAMRDEVTDEFAADFSYLFYERLADCRDATVDSMVTSVRHELAQSFEEVREYRGEREWPPGDWFIPIVHQRARLVLEEAASATKGFPATNREQARVPGVRRPGLLRQLRFGVMTPTVTAMALYGPGSSGKSWILDSICSDGLATGHFRYVSAFDGIEEVMRALAELAAEGQRDVLLVELAKARYEASGEALASISSSILSPPALTEDAKAIPRLLADSSVPLGERLAAIPAAFPETDETGPALLIAWDDFEHCLNIAGEIHHESMEAAQVLEAVERLPSSRLSVVVASRRLPCRPDGSPLVPGKNVGPMSLGQARRLANRVLDADSADDCISAVGATLGLYPGVVDLVSRRIDRGDELSSVIDETLDALLEILGPADIDALTEDEIELLAYSSVFRVPIDWSALDFVAMIGQPALGEEELGQMVKLLNLVYDYSLEEGFPTLIDWSQIPVPPDLDAVLPRLRQRHLSLRHTRIGLHGLMDRLVRVGLIGVDSQSEDEDGYRMLVPRWVYTHLSSEYKELVEEGHRRALEYWKAVSSESSDAIE